MSATLRPTTVDGPRRWSWADNLSEHLRLTHISLLQLWILFLLLVSTTYVVGPLRAYGAPVTVLGIGMLALWALAGMLPSRRLQPATPLRVTALMYLLWAGFCFMLSRLGPTSPFAIAEGSRALGFTAAAFGPCFMFAETIRTEKQLRSVLRVLVGAGAIASIVGIVQFKTGTDLAPLLVPPGLVPNVGADLSLGSRSIFVRPHGTAQHPIEFGVVLGMLFPIALWQARQGDWRTRAGKLWWASVALIGFGCVASVSRSGVIALIVPAVVIFATSSWEDRKRGMVLGVVFLIGTRLVADGLLGTMRALFLAGESDDSITGRTKDFDTVLQLVGERPLTGVGWGRFNPTEFILLDNQLLDTVLELGIPGLAMLLAIPGVAMLTLLPVRRTIDARFDGLGAALLGSILGASLTLVTFDAFSFRMFTGLWFALIGLSFAVSRIALADDAPLVPPPPPLRERWAAFRDQLFPPEDDTATTSSSAAANRAASTARS